MMPEIVAEELGYAVADRAILSGLSFTIRAGECVALLGANGAGKTTLLRILLRLLKAQTGIVTVNNTNINLFSQRELAKYIAYVPQFHTPPFPYLVKEIVLMGRLVHARFGSSRPKSDWLPVKAALEKLAITHLAERPYDQISGGERQATLIARALAQDARILILDEPETGLDFGQQQRLFKVLRQLTDQGYAILATTHDPVRAKTVFQRAILLKQGKIVADGPTRDILTDEAIMKLYDMDDSIFAI